MPNYVDVDGKKHVQLDDGTLVPCSVTLSLDGGFVVQILADQVSALRSPILPSEYPLPTDQVTSLKAVTVGNFPTAFNVSNFPSGFSISNLPASYALPTDQFTSIDTIKASLAALTKGSGNYDSGTLRVAIASNQPPIPVSVSGNTKATTPARSTVAASTSTVDLAPALVGRKSLTIYNESVSALYLAIGTGATTTDYTVRIPAYEWYEVSDPNTELRITGTWTIATGSAKVTSVS
jgi:hypothetical protein